MISNLLVAESSPSVQAPPSKTGGEELNPVEVEVIDLFVNAVKLLGVPKTVGEIYGLLFISEDALALDELVDRLRMSKGSASQGLKLLRAFGAVKTVYVPGDRRDHYTAVTDLKMLASGFVKGELQPHVQSGQDRLEKLRVLGKEETNSEPKQFYTERIDRLAQWHKRASEILPEVAELLE